MKQSVYCIFATHRNSEARCGSSVDFASVGDKLVDSLTNLSLIGSKKVDLALDAEFVASGDTGLSVLALTHKEWQLRVGTLHRLVVGADV